MRTASLRRRRTQGGFTLLEMIVATALLGMTVVGLLSLISGSLSNATKVREYDRAAMLAQSKMDELLTATPVLLGEPLAGTFDASCGWMAQLDPFEVLGPPAVGGRMLVRVQLTVWWTRAGGERRSIQAESYRTMLIRPEHQPVLSGFRSR